MFVDCQKYFLVIQLKFGTVRHFLPVTVMYATHLVALIKIYTGTQYINLWKVEVLYSSTFVIPLHPSGYLPGGYWLS